MPAVVIGPTLPATARAPEYEKYGTKAVAPSATAPPPMPRMAHAMREPSCAWMIIARPLTSVESAPVSTLKLPVLVPSALAVYAIAVHGSAETAPV